MSIGLVGVSVPLDIGVLDKGVVSKVVGVERHDLAGNASQWVSYWSTASRNRLHHHSP